MKAMILAGGLSTRLYPLTRQVPKPLVPVAGVPNAVHLINYLRSAGYDEIAINVHYLAHAILQTLGDGSKYGVRIEYLHEGELMGSAGAVKAMQSFFGDQTFVVVGCDDLTDLPLKELVELHEAKKAVATIGLVPRPKVDQYGVVVLEGDGRVGGFQEKPAPGTERSNLVNTGIYVFSPEIFDHIPEGTFYDFGKQVFPELLEKGAAFYGFEAHGAYWCDIGTPDEYRRATADVVNGVFCIPNTRASGADPSASIDASATVHGNVWIGAAASIGADALIEGPAVIGDGVRVGTGAIVRRSIVWAGSTIGDGVRLDGTIVGTNYSIDAGTQLENTVVANEAVPAAS